MTFQPQIIPPFGMGKPEHANELVGGELGKSDSRLQVRVLEQNDWAGWNHFVSQSPQGTLFHSTKWLETTGTPFRIYGCFDDHGLAGGMVVELVGSNTAGHSFFSTSTSTEGTDDSDPIGHAWSCPYLGVVLPPPSKKYVTALTQQRNILKALVEHVTSAFNSVYSRMVPEVYDIQPFMSAGYNVSLRYTYRFDLSNVDAVWSNMTDKRRNDIRKAERDGITIDNSASADEIIALRIGNLKRQGRVLRFSKAADRRDTMLRAENRCRCFTARDRSGEVVAGVYMVWDEKCGYYLHGGYGNGPGHRGAGALAIWEAIRYARNTINLPRFDLLAGPIGTERFMRDFGGLLTMAFIVDYERPSFARDVRRAIGRLKKLTRHR